MSRIYLLHRSSDDAFDDGISKDLLETLQSEGHEVTASSDLAFPEFEALRPDGIQETTSNDTTDDAWKTDLRQRLASFDVFIFLISIRTKLAVETFEVISAAEKIPGNLLVITIGIDSEVNRSGNYGPEMLELCLRRPVAALLPEITQRISEEQHHPRD